MRTHARPIAARGPVSRAVATERAAGVDQAAHHPIGGVPLGPVQRREAPAQDGGLPGGLRAGIEALSGVAMGGVRVHYRSNRPARLNARAFAQGRDIHLGPGEERHLPHEAWHIAQQARGRVKPTAQFADGGPALNDDHGLEREADTMGARAARVGATAGGEPAAMLRSPAPSPSTADAATGQPLQRMIWRFDGKKWVVEDERKMKKDHGKPKGKGHAENDRYDQGTGDYYSQEDWLLGRLDRKGERAEARRERGDTDLKRGGDHLAVDYSEKSKKKKSRDKFTTPFGTAHAGRGMFNTQPFIGLEKDDWTKKGNFPKTNYDDLLKNINGSKKQDKVLDVMDGFLNQRADEAVGSGVSGLSQTQAQSATVLTGLLAIAESHDERNPTGGALERAAVRNAKEKGLQQTFNRTNGAYVPSWAKAAKAPTGGTTAMKQMRDRTRKPPKQTLAMLEDHLSESSADEAEDELVSADRKKRHHSTKAETSTSKRQRTKPESSDDEDEEELNEDEDEQDEDEDEADEEEDTRRRSKRLVTKSK